MMYKHERVKAARTVELSGPLHRKVRQGDLHARLEHERWRGPRVSALCASSYRVGLTERAVMHPHRPELGLGGLLELVIGH